jgi:sugar transferase (PEP-CTERM/EpsH1 system associated)
VLALASAPPFPLTDGARIAIFEPLRRLASRGHAIDLLSFGPADDPSLPELRSWCREVILIADPSVAGVWATRLLSPMQRRPYLASRFWSPSFAREMRRMLVTRPYDLVQVEALSMADYMPLARAYGVPVVLKAQNVESDLCAQQADAARGVRRWHYRQQSAKLAAYEALRCREAALCLALTTADAQRLAALNGAPAGVGIVPAGVDLAAFAPRGDGECDPPLVLFTGTMDYPPNVDAVNWFLDAIWPAIRRAVPSAVFTIAGKRPAPALRRRADGHHVVVTGAVADVRPLIAKAAVCVAPLRMGGGMRMKILQAMAMGKAIVSTTIGAEGIDLEDCREGLIADDPARFAAHVVQLLGDAPLRRVMGGAARRRAERQYDWEPLVDRLEAHYRALVPESTGNRPLDTPGPVERTA